MSENPPAPAPVCRHGKLPTEYCGLCEFGALYGSPPPPPPAPVCERCGSQLIKSFGLTARSTAWTCPVCRHVVTLESSAPPAPDCPMCGETLPVNKNGEVRPCHCPPAPETCCDLEQHGHEGICRYVPPAPVAEQRCTDCGGYGSAQPCRYCEEHTPPPAPYPSINEYFTQAAPPAPTTCYCHKPKDDPIHVDGHKFTPHAAPCDYCPPAPSPGRGERMSEEEFLALSRSMVLTRLAVDYDKRMEYVNEARRAREAEAGEFAVAAMERCRADEEKRRADKAEAERDRYKSALDGQSEILNETAARADKLEADLAAAREAEAKNERALQEIGIEIIRVQKRADKAEAEVKELKSDRKTWREDADKAEADLHTARLDLDSFKKILAAKEADLAAARVEIARLDAKTCDGCQRAEDDLVALKALLREAASVIKGLADQQAMSDDFYCEPLARIEEVLR